MVVLNSHQQQPTVFTNLGRPPPSVISCVPPFKLQSRSWCENRKATHYQQHKSQWWTRHRQLTTSRTPIPEHARSGNKTFSSRMYIRTTNQGLYSYPTRTLQTPPHLARHLGRTRGSITQQAHEDRRKMDGTHQTSSTTNCR